MVNGKNKMVFFNLLINMNFLIQFTHFISGHLHTNEKERNKNEQFLWKRNRVRNILSFFTYFMYLKFIVINLLYFIIFVVLNNFKIS